MRCPDFTVPLYGEQGGSFALSAHRGQVTVINFWATWCAPCVAELPHFERLQREYGDRVSVVAIHSNLVTEDVQAFLDAHGWQLPFAQDPDGGVIAAAWRLYHAAHDGDSGRAGRDCIQQGGLGYLRAAGKPDCAAFIVRVFKLSIFRANFVQSFLLS